MRRLAVGFLALLLCSGCDTEEALRLPKRKTKEEKEAETAKKADAAWLEALLKAPSDEAFDRTVDRLAHSGDKSSIIVLTRAMIDLPYEKDQAPRKPGDLRMKKLRVAKELDRLLPAPERDRLAARYFRALLQDDGSTKDTGAALLRWTEDNKDYYRWDPYIQRFDMERPKTMHAE